MRRVLFVAEKNDVAKGVAAILGQGREIVLRGKMNFRIYRPSQPTRRLFPIQQDLPTQLGHPGTGQRANRTNYEKFRKSLKSEKYEICWPPLFTDGYIVSGGFFSTFFILFIDKYDRLCLSFVFKYR